MSADECFVMIPLEDGEWASVCFVEAGGLREELADVVWRDGRRPLQMSEDHIIPRSAGGADGPTHLAHLYCQQAQGGLIGGSISGARHRDLGIGIFAQTPEELSAAGRKGGSITGPIYGPITGAQNRELKRGIFAMSPEERLPARRKGGLKGAHVTNHVRRGITSLSCEFCVEEDAIPA